MQNKKKIRFTILLQFGSSVLRNRKCQFSHYVSKMEVSILPLLFAPPQMTELFLRSEHHTNVLHRIDDGYIPE